ncbi:hypothetical protein OpiT1DRAFT_00465 [Opitutaceae bacterium TAV1]|nr:hypothetical protein OpiT1DRAFT_00465 [Opitutaceae bacterium TAV1]
MPKIWHENAADRRSGLHSRQVRSRGIPVAANVSSQAIGSKGRQTDDSRHAGGSALNEAGEAAGAAVMM